MKIGILQTGLAPDALREMGDYPDMFARLLNGQGFSFETFRVVEGVFPASVQTCDGWLITGSRHGVYEDHPFIPPLEDFIRRAVAKAVPLVGICFGHQIIAQALGGQVGKHPAGWAVGAQDYDFDGETISLNAWHQDQVMTPPEGAEVAAHNAFCANAALIYGDRAFTVQAHPEFRDDFIEGLMAHRGAAIPPALLDAARDRRGRADPSPIADRIEAFFRQSRPAP